MHVALGMSMVGNGMVSIKPSCVLGETWVTQLRRHWAEKSWALSLWRLMFLKPDIAISFLLPNMSSG